jgi:hypothetical protein
MPNLHEKQNAHITAKLTLCTYTSAKHKSIIMEHQVIYIISNYIINDNEFRYCISWNNTSFP